MDRCERSVSKELSPFVVCTSYRGYFVRQIYGRGRKGEHQEPPQHQKEKAQRPQSIAYFFFNINDERAVEQNASRMITRHYIMTQVFE